MTTEKPGGGFAGSNITVIVAGEDVGMTEEAHELPSTKEGPSKCMFCGCEVIESVHCYTGPILFGGSDISSPRFACLFNF